MKKFLLCLMAIVLLFTVTGCGSDNNNDIDNNDQSNVEETSNQNENNYDEIELYSDDTKLVFASGSGKVVFYYSGDKITAYHAYFDYQTNANANFALRALKYEDNESIDKAYVKGKYVVVEYAASEYENMSLEDVKLTYSYLEELKKGN